MSLAFWVGPQRFEVGSAPFLKAFFSTVFVRLEREDWGAQYPVIMRELYAGRVSHENAAAAAAEAIRIRHDLAALAPDQVVWDFEARTTRPPWGDEISADIQSLAGYFVTSDGKNLLDVLVHALNEAQRSRRDVEIR